MVHIEEISKKNNIKRKVFFVFLLIITFLLQTTKGFFPAPFGIHALLLIPATVCIAMFEREFSGIFYGLLAGMMLETVSSDTVVFNSVFFTLIGFLTGMLITYLMRNNLVTAFIFTLAASFILNSLYCLFFLIFDGVGISLGFYFKYFFISSIYTTIFTPIFYLLIRAIYKKYK